MMPELPSSLSRSSSTSDLAEHAAAAGERQREGEFAQHLGTQTVLEQNPAQGLQERLATLRQQAPRLQPDALRDQIRSLGDEVEDASDRMGEGDYLSMMNGLGHLLPFRSAHDAGAQPQGPIQGSQLAMHRATVDVTRAAAAGDDVNEAVARAVQEHGLSLQAADGPDGQSGLRRIGQQAASGGLVRANEFDLAGAMREVGEGQDPEQVAVRSRISHPDDVALLEAERPQLPRADRGYMRGAIQRIEGGVPWEDAARSSGVMQLDGSIHPDDRAELQRRAEQIAPWLT